MLVMADARQEEQDARARLREVQRTARRLQEGRDRARKARAREGRARVKAWRAWTARDAGAWADYQAGTITAAEYRRRSGTMPAIPTSSDYRAAGQ